MPTQLEVVTVKLPRSDLRRFPGGETRSEFIRAAVSEKLARLDRPQWKPKTALGRKLLRLSERFEGERLDAAAIAHELRERREAWVENFPGFRRLFDRVERPGSADSDERRGR
jgi:hypothetical protein